MKNTTRNYWLDVTMGLLTLTLGVSALLLWIVLPQGYFPSRILWLTIHRWVGLALVITVLLHIAFHWKWLVHMTWTRFERLPVRVRSQGSDPHRRINRRTDL